MGDGQKDLLERGQGDLEVLGTDLVAGLLQFAEETGEALRVLTGDSELKDAQLRLGFLIIDDNALE